jgi:beta-glucosidase-related glycosidases
MNNGCDLNCGTLFAYLKEAVEKGMVKEERLNEALVHLFTTRMMLGVFDQKGENPYDQISYEVVDSKPMQELNLKVSEKCITLLKNENHMLPLDKSKIKTIGVIGPNANSRAALVGNYEGTASRYYTISEGIQEYVGDEVRVLVSDGCHLYKEGMSNLSQGKDRHSEVRGICAASDVVVMCLGLDATLEGEEGDTGNQYGSGDKRDLELPGLQLEILKMAYESGKPVVLVMLSGSALSFNWADEHIPAIIQGWYPGAVGGKAIANILFGDVSPEGKLPLTFYHSIDDLPEFTDYSMKGRTYRYMKQDAMYPFGYGLSYNEYELSNVKADREVLTEDGITVTAEISNLGEYDSAETVQVYVKICAEDTPNAQLKGLKKVSLKKGEKKRVEIHLPKEAFGLYDEEGKLCYQEGEAICYVGTNGPDHRSVELTGKKPAEITIKVPADC